MTFSGSFVVPPQSPPQSGGDSSPTVEPCLPPPGCGSPGENSCRRQEAHPFSQAFGLPAPPTPSVDGSAADSSPEGGAKSEDEPRGLIYKGAEFLVALLRKAFLRREAETGGAAERR